MAEFVLGIEEAKQILRDLPKQLSAQIISNTASKILLPVKSASKAELTRHAKDTGEFSKVRFIARGIKIQKNRSRRMPGARVKVLAPDIPVGKRRWRAAGYAKLLGAGAYKTPNRKGKGRFRGYGNYIENTGERMRSMIMNQFGSQMMVQMDKARDRAMAKYARRR